MSDRADLVVIGGGRSGVAAARHAASLGAQVTLIERGPLGGRHLREEAASLALAAAGRAAARVRAAPLVGFDPHEPTCKYTRIGRGVREALDRAEAEGVSSASLEGLGIELVQGEARFTAPLALAVGDRALGPKKILLTTGREPGALPPWATTPEALAAGSYLPRSVAVVASLPEHLALAQALARLGSRVTVLAEAWPFGGPDPTLSAGLRSLLEQDSVVVLHPARVESVREDGREWILSITAPEGPLEVRVAVAIASPPAIPDVAGLRPADGGVEIGPQGIVIDDRFRTSAASVFAAGRATLPTLSTRVSRQLARAAVDSALGASKASSRSDGVSEVVPTDPEVARAGLSEAEARDRRLDVVAVTVPLGPSPLEPAVASGSFVRLVGDRDGNLLGLEALSADAGTLAELTTFVLRGGGSFEELAGVSGTPSLEALAAAAEGLRARRRVSVWKRLTGRIDAR